MSEWVFCNIQATPEDLERMKSKKNEEKKEKKKSKGERRKEKKEKRKKQLAEKEASANEQQRISVIHFMSLIFRNCSVLCFNPSHFTALFDRRRLVLQEFSGAGHLAARTRGGEVEWRGRRAHREENGRGSDPGQGSFLLISQFTRALLLASWPLEHHAPIREILRGAWGRSPCQASNPDCRFLGMR